MTLPQRKLSATPQRALGWTEVVEEWSSLSYSSSRYIGREPKFNQNLMRGHNVKLVAAAPAVLGPYLPLK
ncbi:hypothetical protein CC2G_011094 [Coprinopsis cinerea AmutBmut pab1-1]|nr:hypothetical protein CC2G_011094 [Coprinopsis cinerea AmutBmut pab1-1]